MILNDGYIVGVISRYTKRCPHCGTMARCVDIAEVRMPDGFGLGATILYDRAKGQALPTIGITCGDYAKFHRQLAHIVDKRMHSGHAV